LYKNDLQKREKASKYAKTGVIFAIFFLCMADFSINAVLKGLALFLDRAKYNGHFNSPRQVTIYVSLSYPFRP